MSAATASYYVPSSNRSQNHHAYTMEPTLPQLSAAELDAAALDTFVYNPVTEAMIEYLAKRTNEVIACDSPASSPGSRKQAGDPADVDEGPIPTLKEFITRLVVCSNVQVPTLMSSLIYLTRLKARLQPHATGRRSTPHRIFLATLILAAKYLNDSSPKNKHWARYTYVPVLSEAGSGVVADFSFRTAEVNEMERQLLSLLSWDLRIEEHDLYRELEPFLAPIRRDVADRFARRQRRKYEDRVRQQQQAKAAAAAAATASSPPASIYSASSRSSRSESNASATSSASGSSTRSRSTSPYPPSLTHSTGHSPSSSQGGSSPANSSRATTPEEEQAYVYCGPEELAIAAAAAGSPGYHHPAVAASAAAEKTRPHLLGRLAAAFQSR